MNQTRAFLIFAWLMVATLLWMEWGKEQAAPATPAVATTATGAQGDSTVPMSVPSVPLAAGTTPAVPQANATPAAGTQPAPAEAITIETDVLRLTLDGGSIRSAELLRYPQDTKAGSAPVQLFDTRPATYFVAQSGWVSSAGGAPSHESGFVPETSARSYSLAAGARELSVPFVWTGGNGITIRRTYTFKRGDYAIGVRDEVINTGSAPWQGFVYRQLLRNPPLQKSGMTNPEAYSFGGAAWYSPEDKYDKRKYADFVDDGTLDKQVTGGWVALLQHYFFAAWIPDAKEQATFSLASPTAADGGPRALIRAFGPGVNVAPGARAETSARLWVGPKLQDRLDDIAPGFGLTLDYGMFTFLSKPIHWLLEQLHKITHNWGWAIVLLVVLIKLALYPLSAAQYKSMAKMRRFQPRIAQLKERYGEDKQKFQMAMMELYKKEKINPVGGCLPVLIQMPVFLALYWVLLESVELRQAVWIPGWIDNLTARDPYFILPVLNAAIMWTTQKLTPAVGMDPMQQKMMQLMPLIFGVMFAFFPAGLVLYWVTNGALGLAQQWWNTKLYSEASAKT
jgi:YidC/Oxa1 family membrane protein insertase